MPAVERQAPGGRARSAKSVYAASMSEDQFQTSVIDRARRQGLRAIHIPKVQAPESRKGDPRGGGRPRYFTAVNEDGKGLTDLLLLGPGGVAFVELKTARGRLSPDQRSFRDCALAAGADWHLWRPEHLYDDTINSKLAALARRAPGAGQVREAVAQMLFARTHTNPAAADLLWEAVATDAERRRWMQLAGDVIGVVLSAVPSLPHEVRAQMLAGAR